MEATQPISTSALPRPVESDGDFTSAEPFIFDRFVTNGVERTPRGTYSVTLHEDWFNDNGTAFGGYVLALSTRAATMHLEDTGNAQQFPHPLSIQSQFISANQPGWEVEISCTTVRTGKNIAHVHLHAHREGKIMWFIMYVFGSLERHRLPFEWEVAKPPPMPPVAECKVFVSPFKSKFADYKIQMVPRGTNPMKSKERIPGYMGFSDGRPIDLLSISLFADLFTDHRMFRQVHRARDTVVRIGKDGKVPRGKVGIRTSGTISMSTHFFNVPSPDTKFLLMDTIIGMSEGTGDYAIYMWEAETGKLIAIARQVQQIWAIRNEEDIKEGIMPKL